MTCPKCKNECDYIIVSDEYSHAFGTDELTDVRSECCDEPVEATESEIADAIASATGGEP